MTSPAPGAPLPVFDGHNDTLLRLAVKATADPVADFLRGDGEGHIDLPRARAGGLVGGFFALWAPPPSNGLPAAAEMSGAAYDLPLPPALELTYAQARIAHLAALLLRAERASDGAFVVCRSGAEIRAATRRGALAAIFHIEGAEAIDPAFHMLDVLHAAGLRSLGPVWSRPTIFGHGVPFRYPSDGDTGPGLTDLGKALVRRCDELGILIDLAHMTMAGFRDVARLSDRPLVATHSNAHAVSPHARNLTDDQLRMIGDSGGMVGLNFATAFLRPDGQMRPDTPLSDMLRHLDHMIRLAGEDHVGLGSDFDGAEVPAAIGDAAGLPVLAEAMRRHGFGEALTEKLLSGNWLAFLDRALVG